MSLFFHGNKKPAILADAGVGLRLVVGLKFIAFVSSILRCAFWVFLGSPSL